VRVWIDQDCCTGAGLCVDHCPDLFIVLDDGIGYVRDGASVITDPHHPSVAVPARHERAAIDAVERCPGECIYLEPDGQPNPTDASADDTDIADAEIVQPWLPASERLRRVR
jgi:ferredoxin